MEKQDDPAENAAILAWLAATQAAAAGIRAMDAADDATSAEGGATAAKEADYAAAQWAKVAELFRRVSRNRV